MLILDLFEGEEEEVCRRCWVTLTWCCGVTTLAQGLARDPVPAVMVRKDRECHSIGEVGKWCVRDNSRNADICDL